MAVAEATLMSLERMTLAVQPRPLSTSAATLSFWVAFMAADKWRMSAIGELTTPGTRKARASLE